MAGKEKSMCGYEDGPFVYPCDRGCCTQDCEAVRGTVTAGKQAPDPTWIEKFDDFRTRIRRQVFGDGIPDGPLILMFVLAVVIILALANMLKEGRRPFGRK